MVKSLAAGIALAFASSPGPRESVLVVHVTDAVTKAVIVDAETRLAPGGRVARTDSAGDAQFGDLLKADYRIDVRAIGYAPAEVTVELGGDKLRVSVSLDRISTALDTVRVRAESVPRNLREFEERRKTGIGRFFTDSALIEHRAQGVQLLLAMNVPGLVVRGRTLVSRPGRKGGDCGVLFYRDGFVVYESLLAEGRFRREPLNLDDVHIWELAGIEVYSLVDAPVQYKRPGDYCKIVLMWSKW